MTILITGGTGLVGSRLLQRFASAGIECGALVRAGKDVPDGVEQVEGGTRHLVAAVRQHAPSARLLMASTSNVYGPELTHPGRETDETTATQAYPTSKIVAEKELRDSGLNWVVVRFPFV